MRNFVIYILSFVFLLVGFLLIAPFNPHSLMKQFLFFVEGFLPVFFIFSGVVLLLFNVADLKDTKKQKEKESKKQ